MTQYEMECYICGNKFELKPGQSPPKSCPRCKGTFLEMKTIHPEHVSPPKRPGDAAEDIRRLHWKDL